MSIQSRSTDKTYDLAVFIGRCQPWHRGHMGVVRQALERSEIVLIQLGSANLARDTRNPFTYEERERMIRNALLGDLGPGYGERVKIVPLNDAPYDVQSWIEAVSFNARAAATALRPRICLTGHKRDATSTYLDWFPAWDYLPATDTSYNATALRNAYFGGNVDFEAKGWQDTGSFVWDDAVSPETIAFLQQFRDTPHYAYLTAQRAAEIAYREKWGAGPFQTVDPVIVKGDHVLMIERGGEEGGGSIGLPGGFLNPGERLLDAAVREAVEETNIFRNDGRTWPGGIEFNRAMKTLAQYQRGRGERFDDPNRSRRGHLITEAFLFKLPDGHGLPEVRGGDDAKAAFWMPISEVRPDNTFEDHSSIIDKMLTLYG